MKINVKVDVETGAIECLNKKCRFSLRCANHPSSGKSTSSQYNFTPTLFEENGQFYCHSTERKPYCSLQSYPEGFVCYGPVEFSEDQELLVNNIVEGE